VAESASPCLEVPNRWIRCQHLVHPGL